MRPRNPTNSGQLKANERKDTHTTPASGQVELHVELELHGISLQSYFLVSTIKRSGIQ